MKHLLHFFIGVMLYFSSQAVFIDTNNSLEVWQQQPQTRSAEFVVVVVHLEKALQQKNIADLHRLENSLSKVLYTRNVLGVASLYHQMFDYNEDGYGDEFEDLQEELQKPFYEKLLRGKDNTYVIFMRFAPFEQDIHARKKITKAIYKILEEHRQYRFYVAGAPILNTHLDWESRKSSQTLIPITVLLFAFLLFILLKSWWLVVSVLSCNAFAITTTIGIMAYGGYSLNMLSITIPPLLLVLSGANSIHVVHRFIYHASIPKDQIVEKVLTSVAKPCVLALGTTAFGFMSFAFSSLAAIRVFGIFMSCGLVLSIFSNLYLLPHLVNLRPIYTSQFRLPINICRRLLLPAKFVCFMFTILFIVAIFLSSNFKTEMNVLKFLPTDHKVNRDYQFISQNVTGLFSVEVIFTVEDELNVPWQWIDQISIELEKNPHIAKAYGPTHLLRKIYEEAHDLSSSKNLPPELNIDLMIISMEGMLKTEWQRMVDGKNIYMSLLVSSMEGRDSQQICDQINRITPPQGVSIKTGGIIVAVNKAQSSLLQTQINSFFIASITISILLLIVIPSKRLAIIAIPVNLIPPIATFATMVVSGIAINPGTVLVASVAIGIALDDSLHFIYAFLEEENIVHTLRNVGGAMCVSSLSITIGFAVLTTASFSPLAYFGIFTCFSIVIALMSDLILLPALIRCFWRD